MTRDATLPQVVPLVGARLGHAPALDGIRGVAILLVFVMHFRYHVDTGRLGALINGFFQAGWVGVDLFFVLSGFLITGVLLEARSDEHRFRNFYVRRLLRLSPVYYSTLLVLFVVLPLLLNPIPAELKALLPHQGWFWTYTVNVFQTIYRAQRVDGLFHTNHLWSLSVEEQFYLIWPIVVWKLRPRTLAWFAVGAALVAPILRVAVALTHRDMWLAYAMTPSRMDALAIGACIAVLAKDERGSQILRSSWRWVGFVALAGVAAIVMIRGRYIFPDPIVFTIGYSLNALASAALIVGALQLTRERTMRLLLQPLQWRWLRFVGTVSYSAYVYHFLLLRLAEPVRLRFVALPPILGSNVPAELGWVLLMSAVSIVMAAASYRWLELPFLRLKTRLAPQWAMAQVS